MSTGDFSESLKHILGEQAAGLSASTISRLKADWERDYDKWRLRDLSRKSYVYIRADGIYSHVGMDGRLCLLVIVGSHEQGKKGLIAVADGYRESADSWKEVLLDLTQRELSIAPKVAVGDGALWFWKALPQIWSQTKPKRCWVHKTANVLNKLPKAMLPKVKEALHDIWQAGTRKDAFDAFDNCLQRFEAKSPKAMDCLQKYKENLLGFYDFPAEHWPHLRTTNLIETVFATVRLMATKTKNCGGIKTTLSMALKLIEFA